MNRHLSLAPTCVPEATAGEFADAALRSGCDSIGVRLHRSPTLPFHPVVGDAAAERALRARLAGLQVLDIFTFYLDSAPDFGQFERALAFGAALGARYALVQSSDTLADRLTDHFGRFCDLADRYRLGAVIEFNPARPDCHCASAPQALALVTRAGRGNAGICIDPLHLARSGGTPADIARIDPRLVPYAQFSDGAIAPVRRALAGEGELALREFVAALPVATPLSVEVPIAPGSTAAQWCRRVIESTRAFLASCAG